MISVVIPCLWSDPKYIDMTFQCVKSMGNIGQIIVVGNNAGFAENVNAGLRAATGDVIIVCNNDVEFIQHDWLEHLLKPIEDGYGIVSIRSSDCDGWATEDRLEENAKFGSIWAITRESFEKIGYLDERFGMGLFEDLDYWRRAREAGVKIAKNHAGLVEHQGKATFKEADPNNDMFMKNMFIYKQKWGDKAHIIETQPNAILLVDDYEIADGKHPKECLKLEVSLEDAERRWGKQW